MKEDTIVTNTKSNAIVLRNTFGERQKKSLWHGNRIAYGVETKRLLAWKQTSVKCLFSVVSDFRLGEIYVTQSRRGASRQSQL